MNNVLEFATFGTTSCSDFVYILVKSDKRSEFDIWF